MKFGMQVALGSGHIVLDGDPAPPQKGAQQPLTFEIYWRMSVVAKQLDVSRRNLTWSLASALATL